MLLSGELRRINGLISTFQFKRRGFLAWLSSSQRAAGGKNVHLFSPIRSRETHGIVLNRLEGKQDADRIKGHTKRWSTITEKSIEKRV